MKTKTTKKTVPLHRTKRVRTMDLQADIKWIISEITKVKDPELITIFKSLLKYRAKQNQTDWWDLLNSEEREDIEQGMAEADRGELKSTEEVLAKYK